MKELATRSNGGGVGLMATDGGPSSAWGIERVNPFKNLTPGQAGRVAGASFIISFFLVVYVGNFVLQNFLTPGDTDQLAKDIGIALYFGEQRSFIDFTFPGCGQDVV